MTRPPRPSRIGRQVNLNRNGALSLVAWAGAILQARTVVADLGPIKMLMEGLLLL